MFRKTGVLAILDANVIIYLSECTINELELISQELVTTFGILKVWIPQSVKDEVFESQIDYLMKHMGTIIPFETCPIRDQRLKTQIKESCGIHYGEADCVMQAYKVASLGSHSKSVLKIFYLTPKVVTNDSKVFKCSYADKRYIRWKEIAQYFNGIFNMKLKS